MVKPTGTFSNNSRSWSLSLPFKPALVGNRMHAKSLKKKNRKKVVKVSDYFLDKEKREEESLIAKEEPDT